MILTLSPSLFLSLSTNTLSFFLPFSASLIHTHVFIFIFSFSPVTKKSIFCWSHYHISFPVCLIEMLIRPENVSFFYACVVAKIDRSIIRTNKPLISGLKIWNLLRQVHCMTLISIVTVKLWILWSRTLNLSSFNPYWYELNFKYIFATDCFRTKDQRRQAVYLFT